MSWATAKRVIDTHDRNAPSHVIVMYRTHQDKSPVFTSGLTYSLNECRNGTAEVWARNHAPAHCGPFSWINP